MPGRQFVDPLLWPAVDQAGEQVGDVGDQIDSVECEAASNRDPSEIFSNPLNLFSYFVRGGVPIGADRDPCDKANLSSFNGLP
jgi:hypothetical protein